MTLRGTLVSGASSYNPCDDATALTCGSTGSFSLNGAGEWNNLGGPWSTPGEEAVYSFTATLTGTHTVSLTNSGYYVDIYYKSGSCGSTGWTYGDDIFTSGSISISMTAGTTYYLLVDDENTSASNGTITVSCPTPVADPCDNITDMTCGVDYSYDLGTGNGAWDPPSGPWGTPGQEQVFTYTPSFTGSYLLSVTHTGGYYADVFYGFDCTDEDSWTYISDVFSATNVTFTTLTAGVTYYFLMDDENTTASSGTISISCPCIPPAGGIDGSYTYDGDFVISGTTDGACNDCSLRTSQDRIYEVNISCAGNYTFTTCGGASWDTYLYLRTAACGGTSIALNDDACGLQSSVSADLAPGTYYIHVEGFSSFSFGDFDLSVSGTLDTPDIGNVVGPFIVCPGSQGVAYSVTGDFDSYEWTIPFGATIASGDNTGSITVDFGAFSGPISVSATNSCGSNSSAMYAYVPPAPQFTTSTTDVLCNGGSTGSISVDVTAGTPPFTYSIDGTAQTLVDASASNSWFGYMNVFENPADPNPCCGGGYVFGSFWGVPDLATAIDYGANTITLSPNVNTYNAVDPFWADGNGNGNKIMEANTLIENAAWNGTDVTFSGSVLSNDLGAGYDAKYFIKALDPLAGFSDALNGSGIIDLPSSGNFSITIPAADLYPGLVVQCGFSLTGLNANPATAAELGSVVITSGAIQEGQFTGLAAGDYVIGVTDAFGCSAHDATVTVSEPDLLTVDTDGCGVVYLGAGVDYACATINTTVTGGVAGYTFDWTNTESTEGITVCPDSTSNYEVTVTDANGCTATADWQVQVVDIECSPGHSNSSHSGSGSHGSHSSHGSKWKRKRIRKWKWIKFNEYAKYGKWTKLFIFTF